MPEPTFPKERHKPRLYYGWVVVVVVGLAGFSQTAETLPVLGVLLKPITEEFGWSRTVFSGAITTGTLLGGLVALITGPAIDRFGARWSLVVAFLIIGAALILTAGVNSLWQFYVLQSLGRMLTMGVVSLAVSVVVPKWFIAKRGRAVALASVGPRLGNTVTPLYVQLLVNISSWRLGIAVVGLAVWAVSLLPVAIFLRRHPEDMGLLPDGVEPAEAGPTGDRDEGSKKAGQEISLTVRQVTRLRSFYLLVAAFSLAFLILPGVNLHLIPYLTDQGISGTVAVGVVAIWSTGAAVGSLVFGFLAERLDMRRTLTIDFLLLGVGFVLLLLIRSPALALTWGLYQGIVHGGMFTLQQVVFADYYGRDSLGAIRGIVWPVQMTTNAIGPLIAALVYDSTGSYLRIFAIFGTLTLVSSLCAFLAHPPVLSTVAATGQVEQPTPTSTG